MLPLFYLALTVCGIQNLRTVKCKIGGDREAILIAFKSPDDNSCAILALIGGTKPFIVIGRNIAKRIERDRAVDVASRRLIYLNALTDKRSRFLRLVIFFSLAKSDMIAIEIVILKPFGFSDILFA